MFLLFCKIFWTKIKNNVYKKYISFLMILKLNLLPSGEKIVVLESYLLDWKYKVNLTISEPMIDIAQ